jgi:signal transduction histidine kinase
LITEGGVVGTDMSSEIPNQQAHIVRLPVSGRPIELVLQISNFHWAQGGPFTSIELGTEERLLTNQLLKWGIALLCGSAMLVMGIYHLVLFCFRPKNTALLYFGILCLLWMVLQLTSNLSDWCANLLVGDIPVWFINRFDLVCLVISVPLAYTFLRTLYPEDFSRPIQHATWAMAGFFVLFSLVMTTMTFSSVRAVYFMFTIIVIFYSLIRLFVALRRKRQGVLFILLGFIFMGATGVNDMLHDLQAIQSVFMTHIGMLFFIVFQSVALALLYSKSFSAVEELSDDLADKNVALEQEMAKRTRLEREVVNVSEEERRRISQDLHDGLCQLLTSAKLHLSSLRREMTGEGTQISELEQLSSLVKDSVNQAYDLSRGLWPIEHASNGNASSLGELIRHLSEFSGITIEFQRKRGCPKCSYTGMTQLFRIAQEAITNSIKHAQPGRIYVGLDCTDQKAICLTVRDNGIGMSNSSSTPGGLGHKIMAYRASIIGGTITMSDGNKGGTLVTCTAPCKTHSTEDSKP